jgi:hypothetical protein
MYGTSLPSIVWNSWIKILFPIQPFLEYAWLPVLGYYSLLLCLWLYSRVIFGQKKTFYQPNTYGICNISQKSFKCNIP